MDHYYANLRFKPTVPLEEIIAFFLVPATQGIKNNFAALKSAPDAIFLMIVAKGVEASGTHSKEDIEKALRISLPN